MVALQEARISAEAFPVAVQDDRRFRNLLPGADEAEGRAEGRGEGRSEGHAEGWAEAEERQGGEEGSGRRGTTGAEEETSAKGVGVGSEIGARDATRVGRRLALPSEEAFLGAGLALKDEVVHATWRNRRPPRGRKTDPFLYTGLLGTAFVCLRAFHVIRSRADLDLAADITRAAAELAERQDCVRPCPASHPTCQQLTHRYNHAHASLTSHHTPLSLALMPFSSRHPPPVPHLCQPPYFLLRAATLPGSSLHMRGSHPPRQFFAHAWQPPSQAVLCTCVAATLPGSSLHMRGSHPPRPYLPPPIPTSAPCAPPLMFAWHEKRYWGAAHGLAGIAHTLLLGAWHMGHLGQVGRVGEVAAAEAEEGAGEEGREAAEEGGREAVAVLEWMVGGRLPSGNYPSSEEKRLTAAAVAGGGGAADGGAGGGGVEGGARKAAAGGADRLVQWCHGAPGVAMALALAATSHITASCHHIPALLHWPSCSCHSHHASHHCMPCCGPNPCATHGLNTQPLAAFTAIALTASPPVHAHAPSPTPTLHQSHPSRQHLLAAAVAAGEVVWQRARWCGSGRGGVAAGEVVWQRGLLREMGLCHGIAGNAYAFLSLHRANSALHATGNRETDSMQETTTPALPPPSTHLHRARAFAAFLLAHRQRLAGAALLHCGDRPFSLMEGLGGVACLFLDMARPDDA
ncbi:unnamed protein product [Closterium sp. Naga37s-1]|nr:unnamed protein product [Closterium sp. Naga37s-1]